VVEEEGKRKVSRIFFCHVRPLSKSSQDPTKFQVSSSRHYDGVFSAPKAISRGV
jgi:hypothetical protein